MLARVHERESERGRESQRERFPTERLTFTSLLASPFQEIDDEYKLLTVVGKPKQKVPAPTRIEP